MYEYKTELLEKSKVGALSTDKGGLTEDIAALDELLNKRAAEGWELATISYMRLSQAGTGRDGTFVTFKKLK